MTSPPGVSAPRSTGGGSAELFSGEVKVTADKPSNSLVVIASASDFAVVQRLIEKLDRPRRQVFVEAVIMEVDISNTSDIGVGMHLAVPVNTAQRQGVHPHRPRAREGELAQPGLGPPAGRLPLRARGPGLRGAEGHLPVPQRRRRHPGDPVQLRRERALHPAPHRPGQRGVGDHRGQNVPFQAGYNPGFNTNVGTSGTSNTATNMLASAYAVSLIRTSAPPSPISAGA